MDIAAIDSATARLEGLRAGLAGFRESPDPDRLSELRSLLRFAMTLSHAATRFYAGWARAGLPEGIAYTPAGREPGVDAVASLAVRG